MTELDIYLNEKAVAFERWVQTPEAIPWLVGVVAFVFVFIIVMGAIRRVLDATNPQPYGGSYYHRGYSHATPPPAPVHYGLGHGIGKFFSQILYIVVMIVAVPTVLLLIGVGVWMVAW